MLAGVELGAMKRDATNCYRLQRGHLNMPIVVGETQYYVAADVEREIGVSRSTLWRWRRQGKIPAGNRYRDRQILYTEEEFQTVKSFAHRVQPVDLYESKQKKLF